MYNLIIFHYHFLTGGVTDVVKMASISYLSHSNSINKITLVSGRDENLDHMLDHIKRSIPEKKHNDISAEVLINIDYIENISKKISTDTIKNELIEKYSSPKNIWWIHNFHLGKNPLFTKALIHIANLQNQKMVFHIHDFPECSRYELFQRLLDYSGKEIYPQNNRIRYVVINKRDESNLIEAGINKKLVHLLENPLNTGNLKSCDQAKILEKLSKKYEFSFPSWKKNGKYMLYPVRAIRRKNIGEAALLASLSEKNVIITLPGLSKQEKKYSDECKSIFTQSLAPGLFAIGNDKKDPGITYEELIAGSSLILSTSIQEGFGYLFLNSLNWGKPLFARDLEILESFKESFDNYPSHFYTKIIVPVEQDQRIELLDLYLAKIESLKSYLKKEDLIKLQKEIKNIFDNDFIDFSYLSIEVQKDILEKIKMDPKYREDCHLANSDLLKHLDFCFNSKPNPRIQHLNEHWSFEIYCKNSEEIISSFNINLPISEQNSSIAPICETLLSQFAQIEYIRLLYQG